MTGNAEVIPGDPMALLLPVCRPSRSYRTEYAPRGAACALLKAQGIGHPRGVYWIGGAPPLLHLLFYKVVENNVAGNCVDGLDLPPVTEDHKIQLRIRGGDESTRAVRIYGVGARNIHCRD